MLPACASLLAIRPITRQQYALQTRDRVQPRRSRSESETIKVPTAPERLRYSRPLQVKLCPHTVAC